MLPAAAQAGHGGGHSSANAGNNIGECTEESNILTFPNWYRGLQCEEGGEGGVVFDDLDNIWVVTANVLDIVVQLAGVVSVFAIVFGGFRYITSQGEPEKLQTAKKTLTYAIGGLVVAILASSIIGFVAGQF